MKLLSLNAWGGKVFEPLMSFVAECAKDIDIFCFQEVFNTSSSLKIDDGIRVNLLSELKTALPEFVPYFSAAQSGYKIGAVPVDYDLSFGVAMFVRRPIDIISSGNFFTYDRDSLKDNRVRLTGVAQHTQIKHNGRKFIICNLHGLWYYSTRGDNDLRLYQSTKVRDFLRSIDGEKILCGDFNLSPDTESMRILESDLVNLITKYNVSSTRSDLYEKEMRLTDYILTSSDIKIEGFSLPNVTVSDHLPLILNFD